MPDVIYELLILHKLSKNRTCMTFKQLLEETHLHHKDLNRFLRHLMWLELVEQNLKQNEVCYRLVNGKIWKLTPQSAWKLCKSKWRTHGTKAPLEVVRKTGRVPCFVCKNSDSCKIIT